MPLLGLVAAATFIVCRGASITVRTPSPSPRTGNSAANSRRSIRATTGAGQDTAAGARFATTVLSEGLQVLVVVEAEPGAGSNSQPASTRCSTHVRMHNRRFLLAVCLLNSDDVQP